MRLTFRSHNRYCLFLACLFLLVSGCKKRLSQSDEKGYLIQHQPNHRDKRVYWLEPKASQDKKICGCEASEIIIGTIVPENQCGKNQQECVSYEYFNLKFRAQTDVSKRVSAIESKIRFLKSELEDLQDSSNEANTRLKQLRQDPDSSAFLIRKFEALRDENTKEEFIPKNGIKDHEEELAFVAKNKIEIESFADRIKQELDAEGRNFNLGSWSETKPNLSLLSFLSEAMFEAHRAAMKNGEIATTDEEKALLKKKLDEMTLIEAFKTYSFRFNDKPSGMPGFQDNKLHSSQQLFFPSREIGIHNNIPETIGPFVSEVFKTKEIPEDEASAIKINDLYRDRRACLLSKTNPDKGTLTADLVTLEPDFTTLESISEILPTAAGLDKNSRGFFISCGFISQVVFADNNAFNTYKKNRGHKLTEPQKARRNYKNVQAIQLEPSIIIQGEKVLFTVADFLEIMPAGRVVGLQESKK